MAKDLLLEIVLKEMPAHVVTPSRMQLEEKVIKFLDEHHLNYETEQSFATPRRLALKVTAIPEKHTDVEEEVKGP
ncbi:glycine--tRNA ligase subunit beta, partial [Enterococcus faecalis]|uniref:glycine--tRNA ligase subunit beta n=1 Tax=Enterococcus faecalis TaxID=1351 RepID=UPI003D6A1314